MAVLAFPKVLCGVCCAAKSPVCTMSLVKPENPKKKGKSKMKKLILLAVVAVAAAFCEAAPRSKAAPMPVDENGWRCEGDCDPDAPCRFCNPPPKKSAAKKAAKKAAKTPRKRSAKKAAKSGESAAKTPRKRAAKPRKRSVKAVEESEG